MIQYIWPLLLIIGSNVAYNLITKTTPAEVNPFFSLVLTYLSGALVAFLLFLFTAPNKGLAENFSHVNATSFLLGLTIIGLEAGYLFLYRAGCPISLGSLVANIALAVILLLVGLLFFRETITAKQCLGILCCLVGIAFINMK